MPTAAAAAAAASWLAIGHDSVFIMIDVASFKLAPTSTHWRFLAMLVFPGFLQLLSESQVNPEKRN